MPRRMLAPEEKQRIIVDSARMKTARIVQELGLDRRYGYKVGPVSAVAA